MSTFWTGLTGLTAILAMASGASALEPCACESGVADTYCAAGNGCCDGNACCLGQPCDCDGTYNYIQVGLVTSDLDVAEEPAFNNYGYYPEDWVTSGRLHISADHFSGERFEIRWQDVHADPNTGRAWWRIALWPLTLENDAYVYRGYAWDHYGDAVGFQFQEFKKDDFKLRLHKGELDRVSFRYESAAWNRGDGRLVDYDFDRLTSNYNFFVPGWQMHGQVRQVTTSSGIGRIGPGAYNSAATIFKLDAPLGSKLSVYGRGTYTRFDYEDLPDENFSGFDYKLGLRYNPCYMWEFSANYRAKDNPTTNTVSSHVDQFNEYGLSASYNPGGGSWYEAGYSHRNINYTQLNMQAAGAGAILRGAAVATPADVDDFTTAWTPEQDKYYFATAQDWGRLTASARVEYQDGAAPGTDLVAVGSPSLFYSEFVNDTATLSYELSAKDQLGLTRFNQESSSADRGKDFSLRYLEVSWSRYLGGDSFFTLAYRDTQMELNTEGISDLFTTDNTTWQAHFSQELERFSYGLDLSVADGTGLEEYQQTSAGLNIDFTGWGPVGLRLDWFDRVYTAFPQFATEAVELVIDYQLKF